MPKEIRNPKSERGIEDMLSEHGAFWTWGDKDSTKAMLLRETEESGPPADLMERVAQFGEAIIRFAKKIPFGFQPAVCC